MTIASACNKVFRKKCLQPDRIGLIPVGGYTDNRKQSKKAIAWVFKEEKKRGKRILHGRNGKERQLPELPGVRVDGLCEETHTVFEFNLCYFHAHTCMPFRDMPIACGGGTLAERYENNLFRLARIARAGYNIEVKWECEFKPPEDIRATEEQP
jgi:G:T-mismatch repair DNA endonuclease (very short patch repair protein)